MSSHARPAASRHRLLLATLLPFFFLHCPAASAQQLTPDDAALMLLNRRRKAFNDKNHAFAAERFREFLAKHGGHKEATAARTVWDWRCSKARRRTITAALEPLQQVAGVQDFADRRFALYYLGYAHRGLGHQALALAVAKPTGSSTAPQHGKPALRSSGGAVTGIDASLRGTREDATRRRGEGASR